MRLRDFALERFFARWEFSAEMLLCASDVEGWPLHELLDLADEDGRTVDRICASKGRALGTPEPAKRQ